MRLALAEPGTERFTFASSAAEPPMTFAWMGNFLGNSRNPNQKNRLTTRVFGDCSSDASSGRPFSLASQRFIFRGRPPAPAGIQGQAWE